MRTRTTKLGRILRDWRKREGRRLGLPGPLSQQKAATRLRVSRSWLSAMENGHRCPQSHSLVAAIAAETGHSPAEWWEEAKAA